MFDTLFTALLILYLVSQLKWISESLVHLGSKWCWWSYSFNQVWLAYSIANLLRLSGNALKGLSEEHLRWMREVNLLVSSNVLNTWVDCRDSWKDLDAHYLLWNPTSDYLTYLRLRALSNHRTRWNRKNLQLWLYYVLSLSRVLHR